MSPSSSEISGSSQQAKSDGSSRLAAPSAEDAFAHWLEGELEKLELRFRGFTTRSSLAGSLRASRK